MNLDVVNYPREKAAQERKNGDVQDAEVRDSIEAHRHVFCVDAEEEHAAKERRRVEWPPFHRVDQQEQESYRRAAEDSRIERFEQKLIPGFR